MDVVNRSSSLVALRELAGLTVEAVAAGSGVPAAEVRAAERGTAPEATVRLLACFFDLDGRSFTRQQAMTGDADKEMSVFLFNGDLSSLNQRDLPLLRDALNHARRWALAQPDQSGMRTRLARQAIAPQGPNRRDAARQGYALARELRGALGMPTQPLGDLRELAEHHLGAVTCVHRVRTSGLCAAAVRDRSRAASAIVLDVRTASARRQRVAIAHEICHLVFDPDIGRVSLTLDAESGVQSIELTECRARGFAAEFLLPFDGLVHALGAPSSESELDAGLMLIRTAARHFGTPWEIASNHLYNHGFIKRDCWTQLRFRNEALGPPPAMTLPEVGQVPLCLAELVDIDTTAQELAQQAILQAEQTWDRLTRDVNHTAKEAAHSFSAASNEDPIQAAVAFTLSLDKAFDVGNVGLVEATLRAIDPWSAHGDALVAVLSNIQGACRQFGGPLSAVYGTLAARTLDALDQKWDWDEQDLDEARAALC